MIYSSKIIRFKFYTNFEISGNDEPILDYYSSSLWLFKVLKFYYYCVNVQDILATW